MTVADVVDGALEVTVVGSFSRVGYATRRRLEHWTRPPARPGARAVVTGASSGLGFQTALELASLGAAVRIVARNEDRAARARDEIRASTGNEDVEFVVADVARHESVVALAAALGGEWSTIDVLVHNAGAITAERTLDERGHELTVATQLLGPHLLTSLLLPALRRGAPGRVLTVASGGLYTQRFDLARLDERDGAYNGVRAYARVKRAQLVLNRAWARRVDARDVVFHATHPGWVDTPGVRASLPTFARLTGPILRTPAQGVDTLVWLAAGPDALATTGHFWFDRRRRREHWLPTTRSLSDAADEDALWAWCASATS